MIVNEHVGEAIRAYAKGIDYPNAKRILELHYEGKAPSEIDQMLYLDKGKAHEVIVNWWKYGTY